MIISTQKINFMIDWSTFRIFDILISTSIYATSYISIYEYEPL